MTEKKLHCDVKQPTGMYQNPTFKDLLDITTDFDLFCLNIEYLAQN